MLRYFRHNDPFRVFGLLVLLIITRILFLFLVEFDSNVIIEPAVDYEDLFNGFQGPLYLLFINGLDFLVGNVYFNVSLASIFIFWNATLLNSLLIRNSAFEENTFIPASLYIILLCFNEDNFFLSEQLLGCTFLLLGFKSLLEHMRFRSSEEKVLNLGITSALACLFFLPYAWYLVLVVLLFLFYSGTVGRRYLLFIWSFLIIVIFAWLPFLFNNLSGVFWNRFFNGFLLIDQGVNWLINIGIALGLPFLISLKSSVSNLAGLGMTNVQITVKRVFTWIGLFGILCLVFLSNQSGASANILIVAMCYFLTDHLLGLRKKWLAEMTFIGILLAMIAFLYFNPLY